MLNIYNATVTRLSADEARLHEEHKKGPPGPPSQSWKEAQEALHTYILRSVPHLHGMYNYKEHHDRKKLQAAGDTDRVRQMDVQWTNTYNRLTTAFLRELHPDILDQDTPAAQQRQQHMQCSACKKGKLRRTQEAYICTSCGASDNRGVMASSFADSQRTRTVRKFRYARINHLREFLRQRQALQKNPPKAAITALVKEGIERRWPTLPTNQISPKHVHDVLKYENQSKCYKYIHYIAQQLNPDYVAPYIDPVHAERITYLFFKAEAAFNRTKHLVDPRRENLISYRYVCRQLCRLLGPEFDQYLPLFPGLKSADLQQKQDAFWREICRDLKWPYMPSSGNQQAAQDFRLPSADDDLVVIAPGETTEEMVCDEVEEEEDEAAAAAAEGSGKKKRTRKRGAEIAAEAAAAAAADAEPQEAIPKRLRRETCNARRLESSMRKLTEFAAPPRPS
jgi:ribosomal protein L37AE/L43A